jgi:hypothetical protein
VPLGSWKKHGNYRGMSIEGHRVLG